MWGLVLKLLMSKMMAKKGNKQQNTGNIMQSLLSNKGDKQAGTQGGYQTEDFTMPRRANWLEEYYKNNPRGY